MSERDHVDTNGGRPSRRNGTEAVALIDSRTLERECFVSGARAVEPKLKVSAFASVDDWIARSGSVSGVTAILYNVEGHHIRAPGVRDAIAQLKRTDSAAPVAVLSPFDDLSEMLQALECGANGYIPASLGIEATLFATRLMAAGGIFLPNSCVKSLRDVVVATRGVPTSTAQFTPRQAAVAEALRRGKSNKLIAYELNMCESTVKVHIRNIMKKLNATNRTEAGFKLSTLMMAPGARFAAPPDAEEDGENEPAPAPRPRIRPLAPKLMAFSPTLLD